MAGYEAVPQDWFKSGGIWAGMTLGEFVRLLVDGGPTDVVLARVKDKSEIGKDGAFRLSLEVELVPNGHVEERMVELVVTVAHQDLQAMINKGVIR
ncbi:MAG: hypothetical protein PHQ40_02245 [Anaerolineaceae bacterium]|nr:hypothetical protein [Anaerolineaceae bacterium]